MPRTAQTARPAAPSGPQELFREEDVKRSWSSPQLVTRVGSGLQNLGNTCFMNSVLQCLTYTPPLAQTMLQARGQSGLHDFHALRSTREHVGRVLAGRPGAVFQPLQHARNLKAISRSFRLGRQEDAHEYLVALLDAMHECQLAPFKKTLPRAVEETSMIFRIFAGRIRSQVHCTDCGYVSRTVDPFLDISLEITHANTLERALQRFTATEYLEGDNKYACPKQKSRVRAAKRISIDKAPNVLVIQFKRFEFSMHGQKIGKKVDFDTTLDLGPFMSDRRSPAVPYELYGVLVHSGHSVHSGHYYCFVRGPNGMWYHMDDANVTQVSERIVLAQKAYILFYIRREANEPSAAPTSPRKLAQAAGRPSVAAAPAQAGAPRAANGRLSAAVAERGAKRRLEAGALPNGKRSCGEAHAKPPAESVGPADTSTGGTGLDCNGAVPPESPGVDPDTLRARLHSQLGVSSSGQPPAAQTTASPQLRNAGASAFAKRQHTPTGLQFTQRSALQAGASPTRKALHGRGARKLNNVIALHKLHSQSLGSTPPVAGSPGMRGSSPLTLVPAPAAGVGQGPPTGVGSAPARRSPRLRQSALASPTGPQPPHSAPQLGAPQEGGAALGRKRSAARVLELGERVGQSHVSARSDEPDVGQQIEAAGLSTGEGPRSPNGTTPAPPRASPGRTKRRRGEAATDNSLPSSDRHGIDPGAAVSPAHLHASKAAEAVHMPSSNGNVASRGPAAAAEVDGPVTRLQLRAEEHAEPSLMTDGIRPMNGVARQRSSSESNDSNAALAAGPSASLDGGGASTLSRHAPAVSSSDPDKVKQALGYGDSEAGGPTGQPSWQTVSPSARQAANDFLRSLEPAAKAPDEYDAEYDRGKTKKVRGMRQADTWQAARGNVFENEWSARRRSRHSPRGRGRRRSLP